MSTAPARQLRRRRIAGLIGAAAGAIVALASALGALDTTERRSADLRMALRGPTQVDERIALLAIDQAAIGALGQFPWPRSIHAAAVEALYALGARSVVFDVLFVDPDRSGGQHDARLAAALARHERTVLAAFFEHVADGRLVSLVRPLPAFERHAAAGHANLTPDTDGVLREIPLMVEHPDGWIPSLALAAFAATSDLPLDAALATVPAGARPTGRLRLDFPGRVGAFPTFSFAELLRGEVPAAAIEGRTVLIGGTASGLFDNAAIPGQPVHHGVEIHAAAIDNLLRGTFLRSPGFAWVAVALVLLGLVRGLTLADGRTSVQVLVTVALVGAYLALTVQALGRGHLLLPLVPIALGLVATHLAVVLWRLGVEERERRWIDSTFGQYLSPKIIAVLRENPDRIRLGGESRELTVMFVDLAGFTAASGRLEPERLAKLLNEYLSEMSRIVLAHDGVIDKFLGDGMMAFWNAPIDQPDHAARACRSALAQLECFDALRARWEDEGLPPLGCRIGISTGIAKLGNFGSRERFDYTAIGESVNLAARLEGANKVTGTRCIICARTLERIGDAFRTRALGGLTLQGFDAPVPTFELLAAAARSGALEGHSNEN